MYELREDCGTANELFEFETLEECKAWMLENHEEHYKGSTDKLIKNGVVTCGIDTITLEEVFETFEIDEGSILIDKSSPHWERVVTGVSVDGHGKTIIHSCEFWFDKEGKINYDYETFADSELSSIYRHYDLIGEDFKLFE